MPNGIQTQVIATSGTVSGTFRLNNGAGFTALVPVVTSCEMYLQISPDETAANFRRLVEENGSLHVWKIGPGSKAIHCNAVNLGGAQFMKFESSVAQAGVASLTIMIRL